MRNFQSFMAGLVPALGADTSGAVCNIDHDLLGELGGGDFMAVDSLAGISDFDMADALAGISGIEGDEGDEEIGARVKRAARKLGVAPNQLLRAVLTKLGQAGGGGGMGGVLPANPPGSPRGAFMSSIVSGTPARGERFSYMPFPAQAFTNGGGVTTIVCKTTAQRFIRPVRMSFTERRTGAASILTYISEVKIGQEVQPAATGDAGTDNFSPFAVGIPVQFDPIEVNMPVEVTVKASALPAGTDRIDFSVTLWGWMIK